ncbi:MAG: PEGA domain-containing protein [Vicinamibacterales bacterium]
MTRSTQLLLTLGVAGALALPVAAAAQAVPRTGGASSAGSSGSSGASSSTSSGGDMGSTSRPAPSAREVPQGRRPPAGSRTTGSAASRGSSSSSRGGGGTSVSTGASGRTGASPSLRGFGADAGARSRDGRNVVGKARARTYADTTVVNLPLFGPWGRWYPYYNYGYLSFDPWGSYYGSTRWRFGGWYSPYFYPYGFDPYGYYGGYSGGYSDTYDEPERLTGSVRLRVSPEDARVYVDGALVGTVDDFNGLSNHLELDGGTHQLELRADGYQTYTGEITVEVGRTRTERLSLKKIKE